MPRSKVLSLLRHPLTADRGDARTKTLAGLVAVMIAAAVVALVLVAFSGNDKSSSQPRADQANAADNQHSKPKITLPPSSTPSAAAPSIPAKVKPKTPKVSSSPVAQTSKSKSSSSKTRAQAKTITYTVKSGDNLTVIAAWFHQHGYGKLYDANKSVIGDNPDLIFPGQKITVSGHGMTLKVHS